jgi:hypothetical protein
LKCNRKIAGYTWIDPKRNAYIAEAQDITAVLDKIQEYGKELVCNT